MHGQSIEAGVSEGSSESHQRDITVLRLLDVRWRPAAVVEAGDGLTAAARDRPILDAVGQAWRVKHDATD